jgi:hypothetical protein
MWLRKFDDWKIGDKVYYLGEKWTVYRKDNNYYFSFMENIMIENDHYHTGFHNINDADEIKPVISVYAIIQE